MKRTIANMTRRRKPAAPDPWLTSEDSHAKYRAKRAEAQASANLLGMDHGIEARPTLREWGFFLLPQKQYRFGHETLCEVVHPECLATTQRGHGYAATRPPSRVGPDYHGGPWVGRERAVEQSRAWWARWNAESVHLAAERLHGAVVAFEKSLRAVRAVRALRGKSA